MEIDPRVTLREAVAQFYLRHGFPMDGGITTDTWSPFGCRDLKVHLPNFAWRRKAIPFHDIHHVLTGYPFCPSGEFEMAAWEFAAGRYPNPLTTLFCIPLVGMGACLTPARSFSAFVRGKHSQTLYTGHDYQQLLDRCVSEVQAEILPAGPVVARPRHYLEYLALVACSIGVIALPFLVLYVILMGVL